MKKVLLVFICAASLTALQAQVKVGIKGGANLSNVIGNDADGAKAMFGYHGGVMAKIPIAGGLNIQPEAMYSTQGAKSNQAGVPNTTVHLNYINVPVLLNYTTRSGFFAETGPQFGFLMSAKAKQGSLKEDVKDDFKKTDFGWVLGVGYLSPQNIGINARYTQGISKLQDDGSSKVHNAVYQVGVFFLIGSK